MDSQKHFTERLTNFLTSYQEIEQNLDRAFAEMEGRNRIRPESEIPYNTARDALFDLHLKIGIGELPGVYVVLINPLDKKMAAAREIRNAIRHQRVGLSTSINQSRRRIYDRRRPN